MILSASDGGGGDRDSSLVSSSSDVVLDTDIFDDGDILLL